MATDDEVLSAASFLRVSAPEVVSELIRLAARLSDTPHKWAVTLEVLRGLGIDPQGYEDFETGRSLASRGKSL